MTVYSYSIKVRVDSMPFQTDIKDWISTLFDIYGLKSSNFDGYIKSVKTEDSTIIIEFYMVEGSEETAKLATLKKENPDWPEHQMAYIENAFLKRAKDLGYSVNYLGLVPLMRAL